MGDTAVGVAGGLLAVFFILRSMTLREPTNGSSELIQDAELIPYLQLIDRHLDMTPFRIRLTTSLNLLMFGWIYRKERNKGLILAQ
ncbi:MAG: hypothetical protein CM1200mP27_01620 [Chloroflexota bacterium]|nr:MAG: hypothetical protein CM1200mP27_01620 [Chloroflexota bacterium]